MPTQRKPPQRASSERDSLRRRVRRWYDCFNHEKWHDCYALVDPELTTTGKVVRQNYLESLAQFKEQYGNIKRWHVRISMHLHEPKAVADKRPFAYVYVFWQDASHNFHVFRERWVRKGTEWYSRVAGLVPGPT
jgi:hypothetical protein